MGSKAISENGMFILLSTLASNLYLGAYYFRERSSLSRLPSRRKNTKREQGGDTHVDKKRGPVNTTTLLAHPCLRYVCQYYFIQGA